MPLQLERGGESVNAFIEHFDHAIVAAKNRDLAGPHRALVFGVYVCSRGGNPRPAKPAKTFPHPLDNARPIVAPLVPVLVTNETDHRIPVSAINCVKEIFGVPPDLAFRLPKP